MKRYEIMKYNEMVLTLQIDLDFFSSILLLKISSLSTNNAK